MKSATSAFITRLANIANEKPRWLAKIYYGTEVNDYFLCSTDRIKILGFGICNPYIKQFGTLRIGVDEDTFFAPPNEVEITLMRNSTTENLLNSYAIGKKVQLWQWFLGLPSYSDALPLGTFIIQNPPDIALGEFTISCVSDESKMYEEIPKELLNLTDYPDMMEENNNNPWPIILGQLLNSGNSEDLYLNSYRSIVGIAYCIDKGLYKFLYYRHGSVNREVGIGTPYQYEDVAGGLYAALEFNEGVAVYNEETGDYYRVINVNPYDAINQGYSRSLRILPTKEASDNNVPTWKYACDLDRTTEAYLDNTIGWDTLSLEFTECQNIGINLPPGENSYFRIRAAMNIEWLTYQATIQFWYDNLLGTPVKRLEETFDTTGYHITASTFTDPDGIPLDLSKAKIVIQVPAAQKAKIDGLHIWLQYWSERDAVKIILRDKAIRRRQTGGRSIRFIPDEREVPFKLSRIFVDGKGPSDQSGKGWYYYHPLSILYFILNKMALVPSGEINVDQWDDIYTDMGLVWLFGKNVHQKVNPKELLETCLRECFLKMWRNADNKFEVFKVNTAHTPDMIFSNQSSNIYIMKDFKWGYTDAFYNKFELKYMWSPAKNDFQEIYLKDRNNDADLQSSYTNYSNIESPFVYPEFEWIHQIGVMDKIYAELKKYWKQLKIWIEFDTSLVGCRLEPGDTIRTNHSSQSWVEASKDFQVLSIDQNNNIVNIRAIEVIP